MTRQTGDIARRLTVDISEHQYKILKPLEHGHRRLLFGLVIDMLEESFKKYGPDIVIGAMVARAISLKNICKLDIKEKK